MNTSIGSSRSRELIVMGMMGALLFFWIFPITGLASLLSYKEIKKSMPWLGQLIDSNERIRAIVQNSLPSVAMITLNALLPFMLEGRCQDFIKRKLVLIRHSHDVSPRIPCSQLDRVLAPKEVCHSYCGIEQNLKLPHSQILPVPLYQRHLHIPACKYLLAVGPRPC